MTASPPRGPFKGTFCLFSKPLPQMDWRELAQRAKRAGFGGIDLTVRKGGHVAPEKAVEDLPKAVSIIREEGLQVPMITTELVSAADPAAEPIFRTASKLSIPFVKPGYYHYQLSDVRKELKSAGEKFRGLAELAKAQGIQLGYHNHQGLIGAQLWDMETVIGPLDPKWVGYYFDLLHATAEGGVGGWKISTNLVIPRLKMVSVKDFYWEKTPKGWYARTCPLGEGMCDWKYFLRAIARAGFHGPVSLHLEYEIPGATTDEGIALSREKEGDVLKALRRDLDYLKGLVRQAYGEA
jgi:sugar phosphate isomerase/epimerase